MATMYKFKDTDGVEKWAEMGLGAKQSQELYKQIQVKICPGPWKFVGELRYLFPYDIIESR